MKWSRIIFFIPSIDVLVAYIIIDPNKLIVLSIFSHTKRPTRQIEGFLGELHLEHEAFKEHCGPYIVKLEGSNNCISKKSMFHTSKDIYIENFKNCTNGIKQNLIACLPEKLRYIPEVTFELYESVVSFLYDDHNEIERWLIPCLPHMRSEKSEQKYDECALKLGETSNKIPGSKKTFCDKFTAVSRCFVKQVNETCTSSANLENLMEDYMKAMERPCE